MNSENNGMQLENILSKVSPREKAFLYELIDKDPLTGIYNRRKFDKDLELVISRCGRTSPKGTGLLMIDIDHFKRYNDAHGHQNGDEILKKSHAVYRKKPARL